MLKNICAPKPKYSFYNLLEDNYTRYLIIMFKDIEVLGAQD
jgi:hypothetical protein